MVPKQLSPTVELNKATQGTRLINYIIDAIVFLCSYFLFWRIFRNTFCDRDRCASTIFSISERDSCF